MTYYCCTLYDIVAYYLQQNGGDICHDVAHIRLSLAPKKSGHWNIVPENIRHRILKLYGPKSSSLQRMVLKISRLASVFPSRDRLSQDGGNASSTNDSLVLMNGQDAGAPAFFPPEIVVEVKALACELPKKWGLPFSRLSHADIAGEAVARGIVGSISGMTVWRWLSEDAIKPWCHRSWIFPRVANFAEKAAPILDLYQGIWEGEPLGPDDYVISADERTSIQARKRIAPGTPPGPGRRRRVEAGYERKGALAYMAAWDVAACQGVRALYRHHRYRTVSPTRRPCHASRTLSVCSARLLDHGQWIFASRRYLDP